MDINKKEFVNDIKRFVNYLTFNGRKDSSISRAIGLKNSHRIKNLNFSYNLAVKIKNAYINNYKIFEKEKNEKE